MKREYLMTASPINNSGARFCTALDLRGARGLNREDFKNAIIQAGFLIDAPDQIPAGSCFAETIDYEDDVMEIPVQTSIDREPS